MDVHPSRELVASGQRAGADRKSQAHVRIWSTDSLQTLYVFGMGELIGGVTSVAFSQLVSGFNLIQWNWHFLENFGINICTFFVCLLLRYVEWWIVYFGHWCFCWFNSLCVAMAMGSSARKSCGKHFNFILEFWFRWKLCDWCEGSTPIEITIRGEWRESVAIYKPMARFNWEQMNNKHTYSFVPNKNIVRNNKNC